MTHQLTTTRLILSAPKAEDAPAYAKAISNEKVARNLNPVALPYSTEMAAEWFERLPQITPENATFIVSLPGTGLIGGISVGDVELGYWIAEPHWGKGYVTEAAISLLQWHFTNCTANAVMSAAHFDNPASMAVQRKLGFVKTGTKYQMSLARQCEVKHIVTKLTRDAFRQKGYLA